MTVVAIAAIGRNGEIGRDGDVPWHIPEDWKRFKRVTLGCSLIMGRTTFEAIGRPLPGRHSIVISRNPDAEAAWLATANGQRQLAADTTVRWVSSLDEALAVADHSNTVWIGGGAVIYALAMDHCDELDIAEVDQAPEADTYFPDIDPAVWREVSRDPQDGFAWVRYVRKSPPSI